MRLKSFKGKSLTLEEVMSYLLSQRRRLAVQYTQIGSKQRKCRQFPWLMDLNQTVRSGLPPYWVLSYLTLLIESGESLPVQYLVEEAELADDLSCDSRRGPPLPLKKSHIVFALLCRIQTLSGLSSQQSGALAI